jgi:exosortase H (IPTLxxWG-CTERM-specific)
MSKKQRDKRKPVQAGHGSQTPHKQSGAGKRRDAATPRPGLAHSKRPVLRFVVLFAVFMVIFQLITIIPVVRDGAFPAYLRINAQLSGAIIGLFEDSVTVNGQSISGRRASLLIERGCDAIEPSALFVAGVLAFPAAFTSKIPGMLLGTVCLMVLNIFRIISLFYVRRFWPQMFEVMHIDVWQSLFVLVAILFWILWAVKSVRTVRPAHHAPSSSD